MGRNSSPHSPSSPEASPLPLNLSDEGTPLNPPVRPLVAIVGRPNVGKSTLFNRIVGHRTAIVDDVPGVTRDRNEAECDYQNRIFRLVDTGGLDLAAEHEMMEQIKYQTRAAIEEADVVIAVMDGRSGLTPLDDDLVTILRPSGKPVFWAVNKIDTPKAESLLADFYRLGVENIFPISAEDGLGVDELLEALFPYLPHTPDSPIAELVPRVAVVGRPNVGKSTLVNLILGEPRLIVSDIAGTTRDPIDSMVAFHGRRYTFTDTAGLRRRGRIERGIEGYSVVRAIRAMGRSDVAILVLDGVEGVMEQDTKIAGLINKQGRGCVILVNKWDLRQGERESFPSFNRQLSRRIPFFAFVPVVFGAATQPETLNRLFPKIDHVVDEFSKRIPTRKLNLFLQEVLEKNPVAVVRGNPKKSVFITQVATKPPTFALFINSTKKIPVSYLRYLENAIRKEYGFEGIPLRILIRRQ